VFQPRARARVAEYGEYDEPGVVDEASVAQSVDEEFGDFGKRVKQYVKLLKGKHLKSVTSTETQPRLGLVHFSARRVRLGSGITAAITPIREKR
jgi:hypothetical protein